MAAAPNEREAGPAGAESGLVTRDHVRAALTGSIFAMSVLAYLGDHETSLTRAVVTVVGTGLVIFFGEAYAGLLSSALDEDDRLPPGEVRHELEASSMAAAPGVAAGAFLVLAHLASASVQSTITVALWLGTLTLAAISVAEARGSHRSLILRVGSVVLSVLVGLAIIGLKVRLH